MFVTRLRRALRSAPAGADLSQILVDQSSDYLVAVVVVGLLIGIGGGLLLVVLAIVEGRG